MAELRGNVEGLLALEKALLTVPSGSGGRICPMFRPAQGQYSADIAPGDALVHSMRRRRPRMARTLTHPNTRMELLAEVNMNSRRGTAWPPISSREDGAERCEDLARSITVVVGC